MNRKSVASGKFYEKTFEDLAKQIESTFTNNLGPGDFPIKRKDKKILGIITPHAGYSICGPCAAWGYKEIAESKFPKTYVILGPNHTIHGKEFSTYLFSDWDTPLGSVKTDKVLGDKIIKKFPDLMNEAEAHLEEHSIEVQLPFLQYVSKDKLDKLKFIPICIKSNDYEKLVNLGKALAEFDDIVVICSTDLTHYGPYYNFVPFLHAKKDNLYNLDAELLEEIKKLDSKEFFEKSKKSTVCGRGPIVVLIEYAKAKGSKKGNLLSYYTSGDILNDYNNAVGYCSMVFK